MRPSWQELDDGVSAEHSPPPRKSQPVAGPIHQEYWKKVRQIQAHKRAGTEHNSECQKLVEDSKEEARTFKKQQKQRKLEKQEQLLLQARKTKGNNPTNWLILSGNLLRGAQCRESTEGSSR